MPAGVYAVEIGEFIGRNIASERLVDFGFIYRTCFRLSQLVDFRPGMAEGFLPEGFKQI